MNLAPFRPAAELTREERAVVEKLVGRRLEDDEVINVRVFRARPAPSGQSKRDAARELLRQLDLFWPSAFKTFPLKKWMLRSMRP